MRINGVEASAGMKPTTPTIGTATDGGTGTTVSVAFTPSTYIGKSTITYTATSSPGSITGTGSGSPITVSGLTTGTAYTFTVTGNTAYGVASNASAASNSVTPASPSSFESIATFTPTGTSTVTFSSIPSTYKSLQIRINALTATGVNNSTLQMRVNGDTTTANYRTHYVYGSGSAAVANTFIGNSSFNIIGTSATIWPDGFSRSAIVDIVDYASTAKNKTVRTFSGIDTAGNNFQGVNLFANLYLSTSAITSLTFISSAGNFGAGTSIALYGVK